MELNDIASFSDVSSTAVLIVFLYLWHRRTVARDQHFFDALRENQQMLRDCIVKFADLVSRMNSESD